MKFLTNAVTSGQLSITFAISSSNLESPTIRLKTDFLGVILSSLCNTANGLVLPTLIYSFKIASPSSSTVKSLISFLKVRIMVSIGTDSCKFLAILVSFKSTVVPNK